MRVFLFLSRCLDIYQGVFLTLASGCQRPFSAVLAEKGFFLPKRTINNTLLVPSLAGFFSGAFFAEKTVSGCPAFSRTIESPA